MTWRDGKMEDEKVIEMKEQIASWKQEMDDTKKQFRELNDMHGKWAAYHDKQEEDPLVIDKGLHRETFKLLSRNMRELFTSTNAKLKSLRRYIHEYELRLERHIDNVFWER